MMKRLMSAALLTAALPCSVALAAGPGTAPQYCEGAQPLRDGSWYAKSDVTMGGMTYPAMTVFTPGQMMNGMDIAAMMDKSCRH